MLETRTTDRCDPGELEGLQDSGDRDWKHSKLAEQLSQSLGVGIVSVVLFRFPIIKKTLLTFVSLNIPRLLQLN